MREREGDEESKNGELNCNSIREKGKIVEFERKRRKTMEDAGKAKGGERFEKKILKRRIKYSCFVGSTRKPLNMIFILKLKCAVKDGKSNLFVCFIEVFEAICMFQRKKCFKKDILSPVTLIIW